MTTFIIRRILISIPVFIGITLLVFTFVAIAPGNVADGLIRPEMSSDAAAREEIIRRYGLPCYTEGIGAKGCVIFSRAPLREYRDYLTKVDGDLSTLAWLYHMNHGIFMTPGVEEEWTLSVAHTDEHLDLYLAAFEAFASDLMGN